MRETPSTKAGEATAASSQRAARAPAAHAGAALQRMAGPGGGGPTGEQLRRLQGAIGNQAVLQLLAAGGGRRMLPEPKAASSSANPSSAPNAAPLAGPPIQRIRGALGGIMRKETPISPADLQAYLVQVDQQIAALEKGETARTEKLESWREQFETNYAKLLEEIRQSGAEDAANFAISPEEVQARKTAVQQAFYQAAVSLNNMRYELNTSLEAYQSLQESQQLFDGYKEQRKQESYKEPERAKTIAEWDDNFAYLYRRMAKGEYDSIGKEKKKLEKVTADDNSRKWLSTSTTHSFAFSNENVKMSGSEVKEVIVRFKVDRKKLTAILSKSFPAYKTDSYKNKNKDKVLIHQELLAQGNIANTGSDEALAEIFEKNEHFNIGFSLDTVKLLDAAILEITATPVE